MGIARFFYGHWFCFDKILHELDFVDGRVPVHIYFRLEPARLEKEGH